jgi:UDP-glucuronate decarboxylase
MSRSNAIAVGIICKSQNIPFKKGLKLVINATKEDQIKLSVLKVIEKIVSPKEETDKDRTNILLIDHEDFIGRSLINHFDDKECVIINKKSNSGELLKNPALLYLFIIEYDIKKIIFVSGEGVINTNQFIGSLLVTTKNILDVTIETNCDLFFLSSLDVFLGHKMKDLIVGPSTPKEPSGNKGLAYSFAEDLISNYRKSQKLNVTIVRLPMIYGNELDKPYFIANFIKKAKFGINIRVHQYANNLAWVNIIHLHDLAKIVCKIVEQGEYSIYNVDGGESLNSWDISTEISKSYQSSSEISFIKLESNIVKLKVDLSYLKEKFEWQPQENLYQTIKNKTNENSTN